MIAQPKISAWVYLQLECLSKTSVNKNRPSYDSVKRYPVIIKSKRHYVKYVQKHLT